MNGRIRPMKYIALLGVFHYNVFWGCGITISIHKAFMVGACGMIELVILMIDGSWGQREEEAKPQLFMILCKIYIFVTHLMC